MSITPFEPLEQKVARAQRLLLKHDYLLHQQGRGYCVTDHVGGVWGVPHEATIAEVLAFAEADDAGRKALASAHRLKEPEAALFGLRPYYTIIKGGSRER